MIRKGQIVAVTFDDHTAGGDSPLRFTDAYCIVRVLVADPDGGQQVMTSMHAGDETQAELMTAFAIGVEQAKRQERIGKALRAVPAIRHVGDRK